MVKVIWEPSPGPDDPMFGEGPTSIPNPAWGRGWLRARSFNEIVQRVHDAHCGEGAGQLEMIRSWVQAAREGNPDALAFLRAYGVESVP
jgi:hypothetical protein